jgi:hypothetical protein
MSHPLTNEQIHRVRRRHFGYRLQLASISVVVLSQPLAQQWVWLTPVEGIGLALVLMGTGTRFSTVGGKAWMYGLGCAAIGMEMLWLLTLFTDTSLALQMTIPHLLIWGLFIGLFMVRSVRSLMLETDVNALVVMGAAANYLLIGYLGGFLLHTLLLWDQNAFVPELVTPSLQPTLHPLRARPAMVLASFASLTTLGTPVARPQALAVTTACLAIALVGQLFVAVLIALILGRFHRRHPM